MSDHVQEIATDQSLARIARQEEPGSSAFTGASADNSPVLLAEVRPRGISISSLSIAAAAGLDVDEVILPAWDRDRCRQVSNSSGRRPVRDSSQSRQSPVRSLANALAPLKELARIDPAACAKTEGMWLAQNIFSSGCFRPAANGDGTQPACHLGPRHRHRTIHFQKGNYMTQVDRCAAFWRSFSLFRDFDDKTIAALAAISSSRRWPPETVIFQRGDQGNYMLGVISGRIKISLITPQGRELVLRQLEAGELFGEMAMLDDQPRSADATAQVASEGFVIAKGPFMELLKLSPGAARATIRHLCSRLRGMTEQLETIALYHLNSRAARFLLTTLRHIHGNELPISATLKLSLTQSDIAGILGASRPKVNRAILALEEAGAIRRINGTIECNTDRLQWIAERGND